MINRIGKIVKDIQYKTDLTIDEIAEKIGYSRSHLNKSMTGEGSDPLYNALIKEFGQKITQNVPRETKANQATSTTEAMDYLTITPTKPGHISTPTDKDKMIQQLLEQVKRLEDEKKKLYELLDKSLQK